MNGPEKLLKKVDQVSFPTLPNKPTTPKAQVGLALSWAFQRLKGSFTGFVALAAVVAVIQVAQQIAAQPLNEILVDCLNPESPGQINACAVAIADGAFSGGSMLFVFTVLGFLATIGVYRAGIRATQGQPPSFAEMFTSENLGKYLLFTLAYIGLTLLGFLACIVPGFLVLFLLQLGPFYVLDKGLGVREAIKASARAMSQNVGPALVMTLLSTLVLIIGGAFYGILTLVTLPFATLFMAHMYRQFNGEAIR